MAEGEDIMTQKQERAELSSREYIFAEASSLLTKANEKLCKFCEFIYVNTKEGHCKKYKLGIVTPLVTCIVLLLFFQYICIKSRKKKKKEDLRMNSYNPRYKSPQVHMYKRRIYDENMQQAYMFAVEGMHPNKQRQPFLYEQAEEPKRKQSTDKRPKTGEINDENKTRPKKKKKKKKWSN